MKIAGFQKNSFIDYPGKMAAVIFTPGCNLNCYYCHNRSLIQGDSVKRLYHPDVVLDFLEKRSGFLEGVVITGGEPTLQKGLEDFIRAIRGLGYAIKLDTNGTNPDILKNLIGKGLLDYVAMDIKAPENRYEEICGTEIIWKDIERSIQILLKGDIEYEFRTTLAPDLMEEDVLEMAKLIQGARLYALQQYRRPDTEDFWDDRLNKPAHTGEEIEKWVEKIASLVERCIIRGI